MIVQKQGREVKDEEIIVIVTDCGGLHIILPHGDNSIERIALFPRDISKDMDLAVGKEVFLILKLKRIKVYECQYHDDKE